MTFGGAVAAASRLASTDWASAPVRTIWAVSPLRSAVGWVQTTSWAGVLWNSGRDRAVADWGTGTEGAVAGQLPASGAAADGATLAAPPGAPAADPGAATRPLP